MNWKDRFSGRLLSADEAVRQIRSGETISIAHVGSEPYALRGWKSICAFSAIFWAAVQEGQLRRAERNICLAFSIFIPACSENVAVWMCF